MPVFHLLLVNTEMLTLHFILLIIWWRGSMTWGWKKSKEEDTSWCGIVWEQLPRGVWNFLDNFVIFYSWEQDFDAMWAIWISRECDSGGKDVVLSSCQLFPPECWLLFTSFLWWLHVERWTITQSCAADVSRFVTRHPWLADSTARAGSRVSRKQPGVELDAARVTLSDSLSALRVKSPVNLRLGLMSVCVFI